MYFSSISQLPGKFFCHVTVNKDIFPFESYQTHVLCYFVYYDASWQQCYMFKEANRYLKNDHNILKHMHSGTMILQTYFGCFILFPITSWNNKSKCYTFQKMHLMSNLLYMSHIKQMNPSDDCRQDYTLHNRLMQDLQHLAANA